MKVILRCFVILILVLSTGSLYAQLQGQPLIDSLLKELPKQKEDSNKVNLLRALSSGNHHINPDEGIRYGQQSLQLAEKLKWKAGMAGAIFCVGQNYYFKDNFPKALEYYFNSEQLYEENGDSLFAANVCQVIGNAYANFGDYPKSLEYNLKALKQYERTEDKYEIASLNNDIGICYKEQIPPDYARAMEYFNKALKIGTDSNYEYWITAVNNNIGEIYLCQKNVPLGLAYLNKSLKLADKINLRWVKDWDLLDIGVCYLSIVKDPSIKGGQISSIPADKNILLDESIDLIQQALKISTDTNEHSIQITQPCLKNLAEAYKLKGDYKRSLDAFEMFTANRDSIFSKDKTDRIMKMGLDMEYEKASHKAELKLQKQRVLTYAGGAGILMLLAFTFFIVKERSKSENERKKSDGLLLNILPSEVAEELKSTGASEARQFNDVTVLFTDFVSFTETSERLTPKELVKELDSCFKAFDEITSKHNIEKIKTIGDAYLAACGLPAADPRHAENAVQAAKDIRSFMQDRHVKLGNKTFEIRVGIHSGSVVAGIVGVKKFAYDIWGDTVNTAARMEQNSEAGKINISETTYELVKDKFNCEYRGEIAAKGKGMMKMYYVNWS